MNPGFLSYLALVLTGADVNKYPECANVSNYESVGRIEHPEINEGSGLVWSRTDKKGMFWTHNDNGGIAAAFAVDINGNYLGKVLLKGVENMDFEAISTARCTDESDSPYCLFIGDIGDNLEQYYSRILYKVKEPTREELSRSPELTIETEEWSKVNYMYPIKQRNSEAFIIDPLTREVIIISKGFFDAAVYTGPLDSPEGFSVELKDENIRLPFLLPTDASYSEGFYSLAVRTYNYIYVYKNDYKMRPFKTMLKEDKPCKISIIPTNQVMGESLALDGLKKIYIHSENVGKDIFAYDTKV